MEIKNRVKQVLKDTFEIDQIDDNISQKNCEQWDSLRHLNLVVELESTFDIDLEPEEISEMKDLSDILNILKSKNIN